MFEEGGRGYLGEKCLEVVSRGCRDEQRWKRVAGQAEVSSIGNGMHGCRGKQHWKSVAGGAKRSSIGCG